MPNIKKVFPPDLEIVTLEWIDKKRKQFDLSDYELSLMIGQSRTYLGEIRCGRGISKGIKASIYYFFKTLENKS